MENETRDILNIIKSGITEETVDVLCNLPQDKLMELTCKHNIYTLVYYGLYNCNFNTNDYFNAQLSNTLIRGINISEQQLYYIKEISAKFNENNIDHMFLKGSVLKQLYPSPEIRRMGDIDILIKEEQYQSITVIMTALGFVFQYESNHELVWKKGNIMIELHKILMPSFNEDLHKYFGNGWKRAVLEEKNRYTFSDDDMFIYIFSHFAKHYRDAGIGIIHMCDLYIFRKNKKLNNDYIHRELKKLQLYDFYCNIKNTLEVWFENGTPSEITDYITSVIFNSGVYGLAENSMVSNALKGRKKINNIVLNRVYRIFEKIFPPYRVMAQRYQFLKKFPVLLPFVWGYRFIYFPLFERKKISKRINDICVVNEQQIQDYEKALNYVGLDYYF